MNCLRHRGHLKVAVKRIAAKAPPTAETRKAIPNALLKDFHARNWDTITKHPKPSRGPITQRENLWKPRSFAQAFAYRCSSSVNLISRHYRGHRSSSIDTVN